MRKGSGKWKRGRSRERTSGAMTHRSASTSHVDFAAIDSDLDSASMGSCRTFNPSLDTFTPRHLQLHRASEPHCTTATRRVKTSTPPPPAEFASGRFYNAPTASSPSSAGSQQHYHSLHRHRPEAIRTPPPSKPPRKDLVFSVQLDTEGLTDIGIEIDCVPALTSSSTSTPSISSKGSLQSKMSSGQGGADGREWECSDSQSACSTPRSARTYASVDSEPVVRDKPPSVSSLGSHGGQGLTCKVVSLNQASRCNLDGRVKVNDEIVDINGESVHRESRESVR